MSDFNKFSQKYTSIYSTDTDGLIFLSHPTNVAALVHLSTVVMCQKPVNPKVETIKRQHHKTAEFIRPDEL